MFPMSIPILALLWFSLVFIVSSVHVYSFHCFCYNVHFVHLFAMSILCVSLLILQTAKANEVAIHERLYRTQLQKSAVSSHCHPELSSNEQQQKILATRQARSTSKKRLNDSLQRVTTLSGSIGMITRHLHMEDIKRQRDESTQDVKHRVESRKIQNRLCRTRYAVYHDRAKAHRDQMVTKAKNDLNAKLNRTRLERKIEEDLTRHYKQILKMSPATCFMEKKVPPEILASSSASKRRQLVSSNMERQQRERTSKIAEYALQQEISRQRMELPVTTVVVEGDEFSGGGVEEFESSVWQRSHSPLLSPSQKPPESELQYSTQLAEASRPDQSLTSPGGIALATPQSAPSAMRHFGEIPESSKPGFGVQSERTFAMRCDQDTVGNMFQIKDQYTVNKQYMEGIENLNF